jgi:hypothetical protein
MMLREGDKQPRSVYSRLPRRFAFRRTGRAPRFLQQSPHRRVRRNLARQPMWMVLKV